MILEKIDISLILKGHLATLRDNAFQQKTSRGDVILFAVIPTLIASIVSAFHFRFRIDAVNGFLNIFSILTGLLLNVLVLVLTLIAAKPPENVDARRRSRLIREMFANISYAVVIAVLVVCVALVSLSYMRSVPFATTGRVTTFVLIVLTINFIFTLAMILKRMYALIDKDLSNDSQSRAA